jgi:hypothetical protein
MLPLIAQEAPAEPPPPKASTGSVILWAGVLIAAAMAGGLLWVWLRRQLLAPDSGGNAGTIMEDLRRMRSEGRLSQEEYDRIRKNMASRLAKSGFGETRPQGESKPPKDGR